MAKCSTIRRAASAVYLALYLLVVGGLPAADAWLETRSPRAEVHVESKSDSSHPRPHDHALCQVCRVLERHWGAQAPAVAPALRAPAVRPLPDTVLGRLPGTYASSSLGPRAPPVG